MRCAAITSAGERCKLDAAGGSSHCWSHDEANAEARKHRARRAGKAKGHPETADTHAVKDQLQSIADKVLAGDLEPQLAYAATAALNGKLRSLEILRKWREQDVLLERLEALEEAHLGHQGSREHWG
jgi:hypothetical protein